MFLISGRIESDKQVCTQRTGDFFAGPAWAWELQDTFEFEDSEHYCKRGELKLVENTVFIPQRKRGSPRKTIYTKLKLDRGDKKFVLQGEANESVSARLEVLRAVRNGKAFAGQSLASMARNPFGESIVRVFKVGWIKNYVKLDCGSDYVKRQLLNVHSKFYFDLKRKYLEKHG